MRELTQTLIVKAKLIAATDPQSVAYVAQRLKELEQPLTVAALCIAIFDGDAPYADRAVQMALNDDDAAWVRPTALKRMERGLPIDLQHMIIHRVNWLRKRRLRATGAPCT